MKKRKTYEISIIDKTYSKTISDETKFYTSDTALELVFMLKETEYTFESAEIVLLNINDKSLITRRVVKSDEGFVYTFEKDIIAHYGEWKAQLMFIENVDAHVASPIKFRIENDLYNTKPQALSDVVSWVNLKLYAEKLVGEFKQAVDEAFAKNVEIENTFKANEQSRQTTFENDEQSRQTTFEMAESERDETFNTNEDIRQTQELEREKSETTRQTVFDGNEANRTETFNANEATRQENETTRQQAESQRQSTFETNESERQATFETAEQERQSAELIRVSAEEQREIDHANRSAELDGKANKQQEDWITVPLFNGAEHGRSPLQVMKDEMGFVHFKGSLTNLVTGSKVFSLPIGYRPDIGATESFIRVPVALNTWQEMNAVHINYVGDGYVFNPFDTTVAFFDGVSYLAKRG